MANGKLQISIGADEFTKGMTTGDNTNDGGFSPFSEGVNPLASPGALYATPAAVSLGNLDGNVVASTTDGLSGLTIIDRYIVTDAASLYVLSSGSLTRVGSAGSLGTGFISVGITDVIQFGFATGNPIVYITRLDGQIVKVVVDQNTLGTPISTTLNWQTGLNANKPHMMYVFNKTLFITNGNLLDTYDGTTYTSAVLTLATNEVTTALNIDTGTGKLMVGVSSRGFINNANDYTLNPPSQSFLGLYDGVNPTQFVRKIPVDDIITSIENSGGVMYIRYGDILGIWSGSGIQFIRKLGNTQGESNSTIGYIGFKQKSCHIQNFIFVVVSGTAYNQNPWIASASDRILGYGEIVKGQRVFFNAISSNHQPISFVANYQNRSLLYSYYDGTNYKLVHSPLLDGSSNQNTGSPSVLSTGDTSPIFVSKRYNLGRPCTINQVRLFFEDQVTANSTTIGNIAVISDKRSAEYNEDILNPSTQANTIWSSNGTWVDIFPDMNELSLTTIVQLKYQWKETATNHGVSNALIFYTPYE